MESDAEKVKNRLDIVELVSSYVTLKKAGLNYKALCPFHQERTASFMVSADKQIFKCFGCGMSGDVIEFVMKMDGLSFPEALELLAQKAGLSLAKRVKGESVSSVDKSRLFELNQLASLFFHKVLTDHPLAHPARVYLKDRGIGLPSIKTFRIGYAPAQPVARNFLLGRGFRAGELEQAGSPDRFYNRLMFPIFDPIGKVAGFTGRALDQKTEPKYLNTRDTVIFHKARLLYGLAQAKSSIRNSNQVVLVEGQMDVIASVQSGVSNTIASSGTALTREQAVIIKRLADDLIIAFDPDPAGRKATISVLEKTLPAELAVRIVNLSDTTGDAADLAVKHPQSWRGLVKQAPAWGDWLIDHLIQSRPTTIELKKKVSQLAVPLIGLVSDPVEAGHWVSQLALKLKVRESAILEALKKKRSGLAENSQSLGQFDSTDRSQGALTIGQTLFMMIDRYQLQDQHQDLWPGLVERYTDQKDRLELGFQKQYPNLEPGRAKKIVNQLITKLQSNRAERVKTQMVSKIAAAESAGNRKLLKTLLDQLKKQLPAN